MHKNEQTKIQQYVKELSKNLKIALQESGKTAVEEALIVYLSHNNAPLPFKFLGALDDMCQIDIMKNAVAKTLESPNSGLFEDIAERHYGYLSTLYDKKEKVALNYPTAYERYKRMMISGDYKTFYDLSKYCSRHGDWDEELSEYMDDPDFVPDEMTPYEMATAYMDQYYKICQLEQKYDDINTIIHDSFSPDDALKDICENTLETALMKTPVRETVFLSDLHTHKKKPEELTKPDLHLKRDDPVLTMDKRL